MIKIKSEKKEKENIIYKKEKKPDVIIFFRFIKIKKFRLLFVVFSPLYFSFIFHHFHRRFKKKIHNIF